MGKVIWKSALCFAGLAAASWLVYLLNDWMFFADKQPGMLIIWAAMLQHIFWFILILAYAYLLFYLFRYEKHCCLIIILHGVFIIWQFLLMLFLSARGIISVNSDMMILSVTMVHVFSVSTILLAVLFISLKSSKSKRQPKSNVLNILLIITESALCFFVLTGFSIAHLFLKNYFLYIFGYLGFFLESIQFIVPLCAITYAYWLYRFFRRHRHRTLLLIINAVFLILFCGFTFMCIFIDNLRPFIEIFSSPGLVSITIIAFLGNTAIMTVALAFIFRSVEQYYASAADASALQPTSTTGEETNLPVQ